MGEIQPTEKEILQAQLKGWASEIRAKILTTIELLESEMHSPNKSLTVLEALNEALSTLADKLEACRKMMVQAEEICEREERDGRLTPAGAALLRKIVRPLFSGRHDIA